MRILFDKLKKLGMENMDAPTVQVLSSPEPTEELLELLTSESAPQSAENVRIYFRLRNLADLRKITDDQIDGCSFLDTSEQVVLRNLCRVKE